MQLPPLEVIAEYLADYGYDRDPEELAEAIIKVLEEAGYVIVKDKEQWVLRSDDSVTPRLTSVSSPPRRIRYAKAS